jgi:hypothetical protein
MIKKNGVLEALSSDAKCNTPADFISARLFRTVRSVAMRFAILFASLGRRKRPDRHFAGRGGVDGGHCPGARSGENHEELQRNALPSGGYSPLRRRSLSICAGGVQRSSNEKPPYVCSWGASQ